ncbi:hypothetical protein AKO1_010599 [Acrasis kona]|uniref:Uncharacterized protein n=1 Tax=Acrasis kona TaxID=1008807 RepID=A0AAW2ZHJ8_9EUKA
MGNEASSTITDDESSGGSPVVSKPVPTTDSPIKRSDSDKANAIPIGQIMIQNKDFEIDDYLIHNGQQKMLLDVSFYYPPEVIEQTKVTEKKEPSIKYKVKPAKIKSTEEDDIEFGIYPPDMRGNYNASTSTNQSQSNKSKSEQVHIDFNTTIELYSASGTIMHTIHSRPELIEQVKKKKASKKEENNIKTSCCKLISTSSEELHTLLQDRRRKLPTNQPKFNSNIFPLKTRSDTFCICLRTSDDLKVEESEDDQEEAKYVEKNHMFEKLQSLPQEPCTAEGVAYVMINVNFPTLDVDLKASEGVETKRGFDQKLVNNRVLTKKSPKTNKILTRVLIVDHKGSLIELCRYISTIENNNLYNKDNNQTTGLLHFTPPTWLWQFRSTNHFKFISPKRLKIRVIKVTRKTQLSFASILEDAQDDEGLDFEEKLSKKTQVSIEYNGKKTHADSSKESKNSLEPRFEGTLDVGAPSDRVMIKFNSVKSLVFSQELIGTVELPYFHDMFPPLNRQNKHYQFYPKNLLAEDEKDKDKPRLTKKSYFELSDANNKGEVYGRIKLSITLEW